MLIVLKLLRRGQLKNYKNKLQTQNSSTLTNIRRARDSKKLKIVEFAELSLVERTKLILTICAESNKLESK